MKKNWFFLPTLILICLTAAACHARSNGVDQDFTPLCQTKPELGLDFQGAAESLAPVEGPQGFGLAAVGEAGAADLASGLYSGTTFCSLSVSPSTQALLDQVAQLAGEGKDQQARSLLDQLLSAQGASFPNPGKLAEPALDSPRQTIADYIAAAQTEIQSGLGDGGDFMNAAQNTFNDFASQSLKTGGFQDALDIAQEAAWLGSQDLMDQALERARKINREDIEQALKDFDPCLPNSKQVKQDITELLKKLELSILLGDNSSTALEQQTQIWKRIGQAVQRHFMDQPIAGMLGEEYLSDPPACCKDGYLTLQQAAFTDYAVTDIPYAVVTSKEGETITGNGELSYTEELAGKTYGYHMTVAIDGTCDLTTSGNQLKLTVTTTGEVQISGGTASGGWPLDDEHEITLPEEEGASQSVIRNGAEYRIFTLHPDPY